MKRLLGLVVVSVLSCRASQHPVQPATLGRGASTAELMAVIDQPGPVELETVASADWEVDRSGLINLKSQAARAAGLVDGPEPIQVYFHVLRHPSKGTWFVDSGMERAYREAPERAAVRGLVASFMNLPKLKVTTSPADWMAANPGEIAGVLLTHLHLDHAAGLPDLPASVALFAGPGETAPRSAQNAVTQSNLDRQLEGKGPINEWGFTVDPSGAFEGVIDVFGDGSVWALWVPGHTRGSTAYVVRTPQGSVLLTGDACHTRWGWEHDVEPGTFSEDVARSAVSLGRLRKLVVEHPAVRVRLGHQSWQ